MESYVVYAHGHLHLSQNYKLWVPIENIPKLNVVGGTHWKCLNETFPMITHNICSMQK